MPLLNVTNQMSCNCTELFTLLGWMFVLLAFKALSVFRGSIVAFCSSNRLCSFPVCLLQDATAWTGIWEEHGVKTCHIAPTCHLTSVFALLDHMCCYRSAVARLMKLWEHVLHKIFYTYPYLSLCASLFILTGCFILRRREYGQKQWYITPHTASEISRLLWRK